MRLYLDTCIANDVFVLLQIHGGDKLRPKDVKYPLAKWIREYIALYYLLNLDDQWELEFGSSSIMKEELKRMPIDSAIVRDKKSTTLQIYKALTEKIQFPELLPVSEHLLEKVSVILPHRGDVGHICQAVLGGWDYFVTTDCDSVLVHAYHLEPLGISAISPQKFVEDNFMSLEQLVRTLHGSWTNLKDIEESWISEIKASAQIGYR